MLFTGTSIAINLIPRTAVEENARTSVREIYNRPTPPRIPKLPKLLALDDFTDRIIIDMALRADNEAPVEYAMQNYFPKSDFSDDTSLSNSDDPELQNYSRYWHGHQLPVRLALTVTSLKPLLIFNLITSSIILAVVTTLMWRKLNGVYALAFIICIILSGFPLSMFTLHYTNIYFTTFISLLLILTLPSITRDIYRVAVTFFTIGAVTTFFDLLSFPLFTLCLPLVTVLLLNNRERKETAAVGTISWFLGYGVLWVSKWTVGSILTSSNLFTEAFDGIITRAGNIPGYAYPLFIFFAIIAILLATAWLIGRIKHYSDTVFIAVGTLPLIWFLVLKNHSFQHFHYSWRVLLISIYCIAVYFILNNVRRRSISGR